MMVHFFGILQPLSTKRHQADEAPRKASFFGPDQDQAAVKDEEQEALSATEEARERQRFLLQSFSPHF